MHPHESLHLNAARGLADRPSLFSRSVFIESVLKKSRLNGVIFSTYNTDLPDVQEEFPFFFDKENPIPVLLLHGDKSIHREGGSTTYYKKLEGERDKEHWRVTLPCNFQVEAVIPCEEDETGRIRRTMGSHHCKYILVFTPDHLYVIITTANLVEPQTLDMSQVQKFPRCSSDSPPHDFGIVLWDLLQAQSRSMELFAEYSSEKDVSRCNTPLAFLKRELDINNLSLHYDFSEAVGDLVTSVPGTHDDNKYGLFRIREVLTKHAGDLPRRLTREDRLGIQVTSIGDRLEEVVTMNPRFCRLETMLQHFFLGDEIKAGDPLSSTDLIWPSYQYIRSCVRFPFKYRTDIVEDTEPPFHVKKAGGPLFLTAVQLHELGSRIRTCFRKFVTNAKLYPHLKTYFRRLGPESDDLAWFFLTSANLSTGALGEERSGGRNLHLRNFELGVLLHRSTTGILRLSDIPLPYKTSTSELYHEVDEDGDIDDAFKELPYMHCLYGFKNYSTFGGAGEKELKRTFKKSRVV